MQKVVYVCKSERVCVCVCMKTCMWAAVEARRVTGSCKMPDMDTRNCPLKEQQALLTFLQSQTLFLKFLLSSLAAAASF